MRISPIWGFSIYAYRVAEYQISHGNIDSYQPLPHPKGEGSGPSIPKCWSSIYTLTQNYQILRGITHMGRGFYYCPFGWIEIDVADCNGFLSAAGTKSPLNEDPYL